MQPPYDRVGPVLRRSDVSDAIIAAIRQDNPAVEVIDRGAYLRISVPKRCVVSRVAIEHQLGRQFRLPTDLELHMSSFTGRFSVDDDHATWEHDAR